MIIIKPLKSYSPSVAGRVRELLVELSRSGTDRGDIPEEWFQEIISSPYHELLLAYDAPEGCSVLDETLPDTARVVGMASLSLVLGPGIRKNAYLEDFVTDSKVRGQGVGSQLWDAMLAWAREHHAARLEFTCGNGREGAQAFYLHHGAEKYDTNFFRVQL